jgi:hypothetical protein
MFCLFQWLNFQKPAQLPTFVYGSKPRLPKTEQLLEPNQMR